MKTIFFTKTHIRQLSILILAMFTTTIVHAQTWALKTNMPGFNSGRQGHMAFGLDNKIYVGGGWAGISAGGTNDFNVYDPATNQWTPKSPLPGAANRTYAISFVINGKAYMGLGVENYFSSSFNPLKDLWEYDPATDKWTQKADCPSGPRYRTVSFVIGNKAYVVGGQSGSSASSSGLSDVWEYDPATDKWTQKASFPGVEYILSPFAFSIGNKGYISSGEVVETGQSSSSLSKSTYEYDATTNKWTKKADYPQGVLGGSAFVIDGKAYCGLGTENLSNIKGDFYVYDADVDTWTQLSAAFPGGARYYAATITVGNNAYIGSGSGTPGQFFQDMYEFSVPVGVDDITTSKDNVICYPNPTSGILHIVSDNSGNIIVRDILGKTVLQKNCDKGNCDVNINNLSSGQYILSVSFKDGSIYHKQISLNK